MTNGEKLQRIFPNMEWDVKDDTVLIDIDNGSWFSLDWWNAEYKESTTKNLGVDTISRSDVLKLMQDNWHTHNGDWAMQESMDDIRALPTVTPIRPKGHWISHREHCESIGAIPSGLGAYAWCSNCDCAIDIREWGRNHYNYCPNCGANMREVEK